jgi:hypothetical protein
MAGYWEVATRWVEVALNYTDKQNLSNQRMIARGDSIFSYGSHFEMARLLRHRNGQPRLWLINGDRFSPTTSKHQSHVRGAIRSRGGIFPSVIIPFGALDAAGIDRDTVELIEETGDRHETIHHVVYEKPPRATWVEVEDWETVELTDDEVEAVLAKRNAEHVEEWERKRGYAVEEAAHFAEHGKYRYGSALWAQYLDPEYKPKVETRADLERDYWGGTRRLTKSVKVGSHMVLRPTANSKYDTIDVEHLDDGRTRYSWDTTRHWLGESLIRAKMPVTTRPRCKECNGRGRWGVNEHDAVIWEDYRNERHYWQDLATARRLNRCQTCDGAGSRAVTRNRSGLFLSGFDHNEPRPLYFFCELPKAAKDVTSIADAYEALKPDTVKLAEQMGREVHRQGDIFAVELKGVSKRELRKRGARFEKRGQLLGTNHVGTEVAYLPDGTTLVRGTLWHNPQWRRPDHVRCTVGKAWHIAIKNSVPVAV